jgi:Secretion system C-terminal sorting domain
MKNVLLTIGMLFFCGTAFPFYIHTAELNPFWGRHMYGGPPAGGYCAQGIGACGYLPFMPDMVVPHKAKLGYDVELRASCIAFTLSCLTDAESKAAFQNGVFIQEGEVIINDPAVVANLNEIRGVRGVTQYKLEPGQYPYHIEKDGAFAGEYIVVENIVLEAFCTPDFTISGYYAEPYTLSGSWIVSSGATTIVSGTKVVLEASNANQGYVKLNDGFTTAGNSVFIARVATGCQAGDGTLAAKKAMVKTIPLSKLSPAAALSGYPNPAKDLVQVVHPAKVKTLRLYDGLGKLQMTVVANPQGRTTIDMKQLPTGIYYLQAPDLPALKLVKQ